MSASEAWLDFHTRPSTPKQLNEMVALKNTFLTEGIKSRIVKKRGRTRDCIVSQVEGSKHGKIKEMGIV